MDVVLQLLLLFGFSLISYHSLGDGYLLSSLEKVNSWRCHGVRKLLLKSGDRRHLPTEVQWDYFQPALIQFVRTVDIRANKCVMGRLKTQEILLR